MGRHHGYSTNFRGNRLIEIPMNYTLKIMSRTDPSIQDGVFDAIDVGLVILDARWRIQGWNRWMSAATGISADGATDRTLEEVFPGVRGTRLMASVADAVKSGVSSILTHSLNPGLLPLKTRGGRAMIHNVAIGQISAAPTLVLIQVTDVTTATERDRVLRERQNARYDAVVESAPDAILTLSSDGVIQLANPAAGRQFGYAPRDMTGLPITVLLHDREAWSSVWTAVLNKAPLSRPVELRARREDGTSTFLEVSASGWESDSRMFVTAILRDVNERRVAEDALRQLNQTLEQRVAERTAERDRMWRLSTDVMLVAQLDGTIISANPAWHSQLGWDAASLIGVPLGAFVVAADCEMLGRTLEELAATRTASVFEVRLRSRDGTSRQIAWNAVVAGDILQAVGRDVTAERQAQAALAKAEEALRQSQKMEALGQLTGGIAHDFNNLLTGILGAMEIMRRRIAAGRHQDLEKFMSAASASAHRAAALTHRLLAFARRQPLDPGPVDVNRLILNMEDLLRRSVGEQVTLEFGLTEGLWPAVTDANQLENALLNLVINSRDAMPHGGTLRIETASAVIEAGAPSLRNDADPGEYTVISVTDTGTGMTAETLAKVFDPFFTTKPIGQGTGLGLSMVYGFARQSQGHARIESDVGKGTAVHLYLPRHDGAEARREMPATPRMEIPEASGETVLLVEDESSVRLLIAEVLRDLGYALVEASNAEMALPILQSNVRLDLMITDVGLPGLNGRQLAEIARQHRPWLKVLFVTGYAEHATKRGDFLLPGMKMVTKPFSLEAVAVTIREMIESARP
jgi:PAS domain S-box-containing protein